MGSCAGQNEPPWASRHYTKVMGHTFPEATAQIFCDSYTQKLKVRRKHHDLIYLIFLSGKK